MKIDKTEVCVHIKSPSDNASNGLAEKCIPLKLSEVRIDYYLNMSTGVSLSTETA